MPLNPVGLRAGLWVAALSLAGCGGANLVDGELQWVDGTRAQWSSSRGALHVRWAQRLVAPFGDAYLPVEHATPAIDADRDRIYAGSTAGMLLGLRGNGTQLFRYNAGASLEAGPTLDESGRELYAVSEDGVVHALHASDGASRWKADTGIGATREPLVLLSDAVYAVSETDQVAALARSNGELLWRYKREPTDGYHVGGHAGLAVYENLVFAAFSDGMVVALDAGDGSVRWERDTSLDLPPGDIGRGQRFSDVDTTPVLLDGVLYVAAFSGGLYGLEVNSGSVVSQRVEWTGVTSMVAAEGNLLLARANGDLMRVDPATGATRWSVRASRGTPLRPTWVRDVVYVSESRGGFVARSARSGVELSRIEAGFGFSAAASFAGQRGLVLSNGGTLFAFSTP